jgi:hypothetical protein
MVYIYFSNEISGINSSKILRGYDTSFTDHCVDLDAHSVELTSNDVHNHHTRE